MNHTITIIVNGKRYPDFYVGGSHTDEELVAMLDEDIDLNDPDTWYRVYWDLPDKEFRILPEYLNDWGTTEGNDVVTYAEIDRLANEWGMALADLMEQVEEI